MNQRQHKLLPTVAFLVTAALATSAGAAQVDCAKPSGHEQVRACAAAAAGGVDALRQFIQRTRGIYILSMVEFNEKPPMKVAKLEEPRKRVN